MVQAELSLAQIAYNMKVVMKLIPIAKLMSFLEAYILLILALVTSIRPKKDEVRDLEATSMAMGRFRSC